MEIRRGLRYGLCVGPVAGALFVGVFAVVIFVATAVTGGFDEGGLLNAMAILAGIMLIAALVGLVLGLVFGVVVGAGMWAERQRCGYPSTIREARWRGVKAAGLIVVPASVVILTAMEDAEPLIVPLVVGLFLAWQFGPQIGGLADGFDLQVGEREVQDGTLGSTVNR